MRRLVPLLLLASPSASEAQEIHGPGSFPGAQGPLEVGFSTSWILDEGRRYRTAFDEGATWGAEPSPRPVLVNRWFPAEPPDDPEAVGRLHGQYFELDTSGARLAPLARALAAHARAIAIEQVLGAAEADLDEFERAELSAWLASPAGCRSPAEPLPGPFPLVVFHSGAASSYEDDARFCVRLASHGYVVLGSAYPEGDGTSLDTDGGATSVADIECLVRHAATLPFVDTAHVALIGHSLGAQACLRAAATVGCPADAVVLLDTTVDYYSLSLPAFEALIREVSDGRDAVTEPLLVFAGPQASFALVDRLEHAERVYATVPDLDHDEYLVQGLQHLVALGHVAAARGEPRDAAHLAVVSRRFEQVFQLTRRFLDAKLKGMPDALDAWCAEHATGVLASDLVVTRVPRGVTGPEPHDAGMGRPPTPREFLRMVADGRVEDAVAAVRRTRETEPAHPLLTGTMLAGSCLHELVRAGDRDGAHALYDALKTETFSPVSVFDFLATMSELLGRPERARAFLEEADALEPGNAERTRRLEALRPQ